MHAEPSVLSSCFPFSTLIVEDYTVQYFIINWEKKSLQECVN